MLVLRNGRLWDGVSEDVREVDLVCADGVVREELPAGSAPRPAGTERIDLDGRFVLPGMVDTHVHLVWSSGSDPASLVEHEGEQLTAIRATAHADEHLRAGVTTVVDLGSNWDVAITVGRAVQQGVITGASVIPAGRTVIMTGGHDPFWGVAADGPDAVVRAVRGQAFRGAGIIKTAATGGVYGRPEGEGVEDVELSYAELAALVTEAHRRGLKVAAHALGNEGIRNAVRAGVDIIEHGVFLDEEIVEMMVAAGTYLCPTVAVYRSIAESTRTGSAPAYAARKAAGVIEAHRASVVLARDAGVPLIAGTDAGSPGVPHGHLVAEVEALVDCGVPPPEALRAATSTAGGALGRPSLGRLRAGGPADLVVVDDEPWKTVTTLRSPWLVLRGGRIAHGPTTKSPVPPSNGEL